MEIIEQIGSYAGLAAIVGLAVLSALYFSQSRDLRGLRDAEEARGAGAPQQPATEPAGPKRPTAVTAPTEDDAEEEAERAPSGSPHVRPVPAGAREEERGEEERSAPPAAASAAPAAAAAAAAPKESATAGGVAARPEGGPPAGTEAPPPATPRSAPQRLPMPRPGATATALRSTSVPSTTAGGQPWFRRLAPRYLALIVAGVVVVSAGAVYAVTALTGEGGDTSSADVAGGGPGGAEGPLDPSTITVAVLNGTDVAGLAAQAADTVESAGFQRGNVANATEQASAESAVLYAEGARSAAREVGQELEIPQIEPLDAESESLAGTADVVVIVGADQVE